MYLSLFGCLLDAAPPRRRSGQLPMSPVSKPAAGSGHCASLYDCTVFTFQYKPPLGNSCDLALHKSK